MSYRVVDIWTEGANVIELVRPEWQSRSNCRGKTDLFFVTAMGRTAQDRIAAGEKAAKAICAECPVQDECLRFALDADERHGVWGGFTTDERDMIRDGFSNTKNMRRRTPRKQEPA
jgi:WhiB family redox-sensing transcriptional regulator